MDIILLTDDRKGAIKALEWLLAAHHRIVACVFDVRPDAALLRTCAQHGIPAIDAADIYGEIDRLETPDLIISYLFRHKIKKELIDFAPINAYGHRNIINFHPGPLPEAKGVGMSSQAILNGYSEWGATAHYICESFDEGDIIDKSCFPIPDGITSIELQLLTQLEQLRLFKKTIPVFENGGCLGTKQAKTGTYYSNKLLQASKPVTLGESEDELDRKVRGLFYPPYDGAYLTIGEKRYTLIDSGILKRLVGLFDRYEDELFLSEDPS